MHHAETWRSIQAEPLVLGLDIGQQACAADDKTTTVLVFPGYRNALLNLAEETFASSTRSIFKHLMSGSCLSLCTPTTTSGHTRNKLLFLLYTHLYPTLFPVPSRAFFFPSFFRRETKDERTTAAADTSSSLRAGPHHGLRRKAANTALELFPGITTYFGRWREATRSEREKLMSTHGRSWTFPHSRAVFS